MPALSGLGFSRLMPVGIGHEQPDPLPERRRHRADRHSTATWTRIFTGVSDLRGRPALGTQISE